MKAEKSTMKIANLTIYRILSRMQILTSNVYEPGVLTAELMALMKQPKQAVENRS